MKTLVLTLSLLSLSSLAEAAMPKALEKAVNGKIQSLAANYKQAGLQARRTDCANFSGKWAGTCQIGDETANVNFTIEQKDCGSLSLDGDTLAFGQNNMSTSSAILFFANAATSSKLSEDGQIAKLYVEAIADSPLLPDPITASVIGQMQKAGDSLQINGSLALRVAGEEKAKIQGSCQLAKAE